MSEDKEKIESLIELEKRVQAILADINNLKNKDTGKNYESLIKKSKELEGKLKEKTREFDELQEKFQLINQELLEIKQEKMFFENYYCIQVVIQDKLHLIRALQIFQMLLHLMMLEFPLDSLLHVIA